MDGIKGVLLCGGEGTRLRPMTEVINKHMVRVHELPMAEYPLRKMIEAGVKDILIVSGGENFAAVVKYFGSGKKWGINITHAIQDRAGGIAQALGLAENFVGNSKALVCLGDNIWNMNIREHVEEFVSLPSGRAFLFVIKSTTPERFGVMCWDDTENIPIEIIEKPKHYISNDIVSGIYLYGPEVFKKIKTLKPSGRGELEITDVNNYYVKSGLIRVVPMTGYWSDCGTMDTLLKAEELIKNDRLIPAVCTKDSH